MAAAAARARVDNIPGWFHWLDRRLFHAVLQAQEDGPPGHLVELGCYLGKSAVVMGEHRRGDETFYVIDLFGDESLLDQSAEATANRQEATYSYAALNRPGFEANYLRFHAELPEIIEGPSSQIIHHVPAGSARFVHVDASHLYAQVREDSRNAATLLTPGGVVVYDDYRAEHTPGVAAAVWQAVLNDGLIPFAITSRKLYGCYSGHEHYLAAVRRFAAEQTDVKLSEESVAGHHILRLRPRPGQSTVTVELSAELARKVSRQVSGDLKPELAAIRRRLARMDQHSTAPERTPTTPTARRSVAVLRDLTPPLITRWWRSRRGKVTSPGGRGSSAPGTGSTDPAWPGPPRRPPPQE